MKYYDGHIHSIVYVLWFSPFPLSIGICFSSFCQTFLIPLTWSSLVWLSEINVTCCVWHWLAGDAGREKNTRLIRVSISPHLSGKTLAESDSTVKLWCLLMGTAMGQVNDSPYYCVVELVVGLWSKFHLFKAPRSAVSTLICLCKMFCSCCC